MNIDTLNAHCGPWLVYCPCLAQGRLNIHPGLKSRHWALPLTAPAARGGFKFTVAGMPLGYCRLSGRVKTPGSALPRVLLAGRSPRRRPRALRRLWVRDARPFTKLRPESRQDYPPNLSILISGGKENNCDALSNGE